MLFAIVANDLGKVINGMSIWNGMGAEWWPGEIFVMVIETGFAMDLWAEDLFPVQTLFCPGDNGDV